MENSFSRALDMLLNQIIPAERRRSPSVYETISHAWLVKRVIPNLAHRSERRLLAETSSTRSVVMSLLDSIRSEHFVTCAALP
jgi:hypothetical protein